MSSLFRLGFALFVLAIVNSCGSGAVSGPPPVNDPTKITILPAGTSLNPVTAYSGLPTTFTITGGTGAYIVSSDNQAAIALSGPINGTTITVIPNPVLADTTVTISVRDTGTAPIATTIVTVKAGTVNNSVTITPANTSCQPALCSGDDALVSTTISQGGIPLAARSVRFDVVTGTFSFVTTVNGVESLTSTVSVLTDETGKATARIRIPAGAANQSALIQITDLGTGTFQRTSFTIAQSTGSSPGFSVLPSSAAFTGVLQGQCASNVSALFTIVGGVPPYTVSSGTSAFLVLPTTVASSGGTFAARTNGTCSPTPGTTFVVTDSSGHTATATAVNTPGTTAAPALAVSPGTVTLTSCSGKASVSVGGGVSTTYFASAGSDSLAVSVTGNTVSIGRKNPSPGAAGPLSVGVTDGTSVASVIVDVTGDAAGACPAPLVLTPSAVTLTDCTTPQTVNLSGGDDATYSAISGDPGVTASVAGSILTIRRKPATAAPVSPSQVTVTSGGSQNTVAVTTSGAAAAACP